MIVYSGTYLAAELAAGRPGFLPRILWDNKLRYLLPGAVTASTEDLTGPKDAILRPETYEAWLMTAVPATIEVNLGSAQNIAGIGLAGHQFGSKGVTVTAETKLAAGAWVTFATAAHAPTNDSPTLFLDTQRSADRIRITVAGAIAKLPVVYAGPVLTMEKGLQYGFRPPTLNRTTEYNNMVSEGGEYLGTKIWSKGFKTNPSFKGLGEVWYRNNFDPFVAGSRGYPYLLAWRPDTFLNEVVYGWHKGDPAPSYQNGYQLNISWEMTGLGND